MVSKNSNFLLILSINYKKKKNYFLSLKMKKELLKFRNKKYIFDKV